MNPLFCIRTSPDFGVSVLSLSRRTNEPQAVLRIAGIVWAKYGRFRRAAARLCRRLLLASISPGPPIRNSVFAPKPRQFANARIPHWAAQNAPAPLFRQRRSRPIHLPAWASCERTRVAAGFLAVSYHIVAKPPEFAGNTRPSAGWRSRHALAVYHCLHRCYRLAHLRPQARRDCEWLGLP